MACMMGKRISSSWGNIWGSLLTLSSTVLRALRQPKAARAPMSSSSSASSEPCVCQDRHCLQGSSNELLRQSPSFLQHATCRCATSRDLPYLCLDTSHTQAASRALLQSCTTSCQQVLFINDASHMLIEGNAGRKVDHLFND